MATRKHCDICEEIIHYRSPEFRTYLGDAVRKVRVEITNLDVYAPTPAIVEICANCCVRIMSQIVTDYTKNSG